MIATPLSIMLRPFKIPSTLFPIVIDSSPTLAAEPSGFDQFNKKRSRSVFFTQLVMEGFHTIEKNV
jgi:hypothetical protein